MAAKLRLIEDHEHLENWVRVFLKVTFRKQIKLLHNLSKQTVMNEPPRSKVVPFAPKCVTDHPNAYIIDAKKLAIYKGDRTKLVSKSFIIISIH